MFAGMLLNRVEGISPNQPRWISALETGRTGCLEWPMHSNLPTRPGAPALEARGLVKRYGRRPPALRGLDLSIELGGIVALVGPNGAGKSTLIKTWVGLEAPTRGHVAILGIDTWRNRRRAVGLLGYVPQTPALYRALTVAEHLDLAGSLRRGFDRSYAQRRLAELGVPLKARAGEISGGQQAQVGLALALGTRAPVLLLDEPLASLDPVARRDFLHVLRDAVIAQGSTCILSSHVVTDIEEACDRLVVLAAGQKLLDDTLASAIEGHRVSDAQPATRIRDATHVASFTAGDRSVRTLWRLEPGAKNVTGADLREASLDEVVVGYLSLAKKSEQHG